MDYEEALEMVGGFGRFQIIMFVALGASCIKMAFNLQIAVMGLFEVDFRCADGDPIGSINRTSLMTLSGGGGANMHVQDLHRVSAANLTYDNRCSGYILNGTWVNETCQVFEYDFKAMHSTLVSEMNLVCDKSYWVALLLSLTSVGVFIGQILGALADNYLHLGRRTILLICCTIDLLFTPVSAFMPDPVSQGIIKLIRGIPQNMIPYQGIILIEEIVSAKWRSFVGNNYWLFWCFGYAGIAGVGFLIPVRKTLDLINEAPCIFYILIVVLVPESPRWQIVNGKMSEAIATFRKIARYNGKKLDRNALTEIKVEAEEEEDFFYAMKKFALMRRKQLVLCALTFTHSLCYFGLSMDATFASANMFFNIFLNGCIEVPSSLLAWKLSDSLLGRRWSTMLMQCIAGLCIMAVPFIPKTGVTAIVRTCVAITGKLTLTGAFCVLIVHTVELLPTSIRNSGMLVTAFVNTIGSIAAPFILRLNSVVYFLPMLLFGSLAFSTTFLLCLLPETRGIPLPQSVGEAESFTRHAADKEAMNMKKAESLELMKPLQDFHHGVEEAKA